MDGKTASHHLDLLLEADVVDAYREGRRRYFTLVRGVELAVEPGPGRRFVARFTGEAPDGDDAVGEPEA